MRVEKITVPTENASKKYELLKIPVNLDFAVDEISPSEIELKVMVFSNKLMPYCKTFEIGK